jgi:hypothetical protein
MEFTDDADDMEVPTDLLFDFDDTTPLPMEHKEVPDDLAGEFDEEVQKNVPAPVAEPLPMVEILTQHVPNLADVLMRICVILGTVVNTGVFIRLLNSVAMLLNNPIDDCAHAMQAYIDEHHPIGCATSKLSLTHGVQLWQREATAVTAAAAAAADKEVAIAAAAADKEVAIAAAAADKEVEVDNEGAAAAEATSTASTASTSEEATGAPATEEGREANGAPQPAAPLALQFVNNDEAVHTLKKFAILTRNKWADAVVTIVEATIGLARSMQMLLLFVDAFCKETAYSGSMLMIHEFVLTRIGLLDLRSRVPSPEDAQFSLKSGFLCLSVLEDWYKPLEESLPFGEFFVSRYALLECSLMLFRLEGKLQLHRTTKCAAPKRANALQGEQKSRNTKRKSVCASGGNEDCAPFKQPRSGVSKTAAASKPLRRAASTSGVVHFGGATTVASAC